MTLPLLPSANYVAVSIANKTATNGGGLPDTGLYLSLVSQTRAYCFTQYKNADGKTVYLAEVDTPSGDTVASLPLASLANEIDGTKGFYIEVFAEGALVAFTGGRLYFASRADAVPYLSNAPSSIAPDAGFDFDFVEFTVDPATAQLNLDTTQVDQFGMPIYLQVDPLVADFAGGTGIVPDQTRAGVIAEFQAYTAAGTDFTAYQGVAPASAGDLQRLLAPQHVIDGQPSGSATRGLREAFDAALYRLFNHYYGGTGGGGHTLYLVGNGSNGFEIFAGTVIDDFAAKDKNGNAGTYTVFQFTGTGFYYDGADATLTPVASGGGATYQVFYPYFSDNDANAFNVGLSSSSKAPYWYGGFPSASAQYNLPITSAGRMVFGASGSFADNASQQAYYLAQGTTPTNFSSVMLGNLENQLVTLLNRGVTPDTGSTGQAANLALRTGANTANDLIYVDLTHTRHGSTGKIAYDSARSLGATTSYGPADLSGPAGLPAGDAVLWNSLAGTIYFASAGAPVAIQTFAADPNDVTADFVLTPCWQTPPSNQVQSASFGFDGSGKVNQINFVWASAVGITTAGVQVDFSLAYGKATSEPHYATLRLFSPYGQPQVTFQSGDLGPTSGFSAGLTGAATPDQPNSGMTMTGIGISNPTYLFRTAPEPSGSVVIYSPQALPDGLNTNILTFSTFYPVDSSDAPVGQWNAYAGFFHIGDPAHGVPPPTVDGKGYAFAYDDNGGYSSDISVTLPTSLQTPPVVTTLELTLLPWQAVG